MNNLIDFKNFLAESISASEAYIDRDSIKTLVDGKRELAYLAISTQQLLDPRDHINALKFAIDNDLHFSMKMYSNRRKELNALKKVLQQESGNN